MSRCRRGSCVGGGWRDLPAARSSLHRPDRENLDHLGDVPAETNKAIGLASKLPIIQAIGTRCGATAVHGSDRLKLSLCPTATVHAPHAEAVSCDEMFTRSRASRATLAVRLGAGFLSVGR